MNNKSRYTAIVDDVSYSSKPLGHYQSIVLRMMNKGNETYSLDEIKESLWSGKTITPFRYKTHLSGKIIAKNNENFVGTNLVMLDIDGGMTLQEMLDMHENVGLLPNMYYTSFSHSNSQHKFRVLYCMPYMINTPEEYKLIWKTFDKFYKEGEVLDSTHDVSRMFFGTNQEPVIMHYDYFDIASLADKMGTLLSKNDDGRLKLGSAELITKDMLDSISSVPEDQFYASDMIRQFENIELDGEGDYHKVRSLMFVYYYMDKFDDFLELAIRNKPKYPKSKWEKDIESDLSVGRTGHTHTYQVLKEIGAFENHESSKNERVIRSNYLDNRLEALQCFKELDNKIDKYLSLDKVKEIIELARSGKKILIIAPTGSGKTYSIIQAFKDLNYKCIISVPNRMNAQQNKEIYNIGGAFAGNSLDKEMIDNNIVCAVWEMLGSRDLDFHDYVLVNDEAHAHVHDNSYRGKSIQGIYRVAPRFRGSIDITATPTGLDLTQYTHIFRFYREDNIEYKVNILVGTNETDRLSILSASEGRCILLENKKKNLIYYKAKLDSEYAGMTEIVTSDKKEENETFLSIARDEKLLKDTKYLLCTSVLTAGVNILDEDITDICIVGIKNVTTIKQFIARARNVKKLNVHIFLSEGSRDYYTFNIFEERAYEALILEKRAVEIDNDIDRDLLDTESSLRRAKLKRDALEIQEDYQKLDEEVWRKYYTHLSVSNFKIALEEFFSDIFVFRKEYETDEDAKAFKDLLASDDDELSLLDIDDLLGDYSSLSTEGVSVSLGYYESIPRGKRHIIYKNLKELYPNVESKDITSVSGIDKPGMDKVIKTYSYAMSRGYSHKIASRAVRDEIDLNKVEAQITALMFLSDRNRYKSNSPAYIMIDTIANRLPKNQDVKPEIMKEICSIIDQREYRDTDRWSNTLIEINKLIPVKKSRKTGMYAVGDWEFDIDITKEVIKRATDIRHNESLDLSVRKANRERLKWLELADKFRSRE